MGLRLEGAISEQAIITIKGVEVEAPKDRVLVDRGAFGALISLKGGMNVIMLRAGKVETQVRVFYVSKDDVKKGKTGPQDFKRFYVHMDPGLLGCKECHLFRRRAYDFKRVIPVQANCSTGKCHVGYGQGGPRPRSRECGGLHFVSQSPWLL